MFQVAELVPVDKIDLLPHLGFSVAAAVASARRVNPAPAIRQFAPP
jgi:Ni2+-binding GTPase involved in maturation of urease and hydrogenase